MKLFRAMRLEELRNKRLPNYIIYAAGEIILLVFGILIALQVNNWNQRNQAAQAEELYIQNIIRDLQDQIKSIDEQSKREQEFFELSRNILNDYYQTNTLRTDSAFFNMGTRLTIRRTFTIHDPSFTDLISSGNIKIIRDAEKRDQIIQYYQDLERVEKIVQANNTQFVDQLFTPIYVKYGYYAPGAIQGYQLIQSKMELSGNFERYCKSMQRISSETLSGQPLLELLNAISQRHVVATGHLSYMKTIRTRTENLISALEST